MGKLKSKPGFMSVVETAVKYFESEHILQKEKPVIENTKAEIERLYKEIEEISHKINDVEDDKRKIESDCAFLKNLHIDVDETEKNYKLKTNQLAENLKHKDIKISEYHEKVTKMKRNESNCDIALQRVASKNALDVSFDLSINEIVVNTPMSLRAYKSMENLQANIIDKETKLEKFLAKIQKLEEEIYSKNLEIEEINSKMKIESIEKKRLIMQNKHLFDEKHKMGMDSLKVKEDKPKTLFRSRTAIFRK